MVTTKQTPITVAIIEDDAGLRESFCGIIERAPDCRCVGAYGNAEEALSAIPQLNPTVVLMDINLPGMDGVECVRQMLQWDSSPQILMLTVHEDTDFIFESLSAGASGYLLKPVRAAELLAAVKNVYAGGAPMTSSIARKVVQSFKHAKPARGGTDDLSPREREILEYLAKGYSYKETAEQIGISYSTVHTHIEHIYHKLHVRSRAQAVAKYLGV
ncbi:MAG TPA: response regulator transcription factor [Verrucomicrobiae bacterium]